MDVGRLRNKIHSIVAHGMDRLVELVLGDVRRESSGVSKRMGSEGRLSTIE